MRKEQIITTNNNQMEEKGMKNRFIHFKKRFVPALSGALMGVMLMSTTCFAAGTGTSAVTQPLENLKTLIIAVIGAVDILMAQSEDEAKDIALSLELFVNGSLNIFNHQTNVDVDNRFTVYGIRDLGTELSPITMLANSEFVALLKQANTDSSKMAEVIGVSEAQLRFVTNTASGMGLIKCGSVVISFDNQISKDTDLYRLYNTNIHEKIAEQKKKEAMLQ